MSSAKKKLVNKAGRTLLATVERVLRNKSPEKAAALGERFGRLLWRIAGSRRKRTLDNLRLAFPEKSESERAAIAQEVFEHFGRSSTDFLQGNSWTIESIESSTEISGIEHIDAALAKGKGVLLITGHLGNWERASAWLSLKGYKLFVIARDADDEDVNRIVNDIRRRPGTGVIPRGQAARQVLLRLRENAIVGILPDQNASDIFIPFFGHPAGTPLGPGLFAARTGASAVPVACVYVGEGRYKMTFYPPLEPDAEESVPGEGLMRSINRWLEHRIRENPGQWLWMHDRWRNARRKGLM